LPDFSSVISALASRRLSRLLGIPEMQALLRVSYPQAAIKRDFPVKNNS
jgi:hypothetical protein